MNKDQVKGAVKDAAGKVQREVGDAIDSPEQQAKGAARQAEGKAQKAYGDGKEAVKDAASDLDRATTRKNPNSSDY